MLQRGPVTICPVLCQKKEKQRETSSKIKGGRTLMGLNYNDTVGYCKRCVEPRTNR